MALPSDNNRPTNASVVLGRNTNTHKDITITDEERLRGISIVGTTGTGKSPLLTSITRQVIEKGECVVLIAVEPDIINDLSGRLPQARMNDVVRLDLSDRQQSLGIHYTVWEQDIEQAIELFKRLWDIGSHTPNLENTLRASLLTLHYNNLTLDRMPDLLRDKAFREKCIANIPDTLDAYFVRDFWQNDFNLRYIQRELHLADSTLNKIMQMLTDKYIMYIIAQTVNTLHIRKDILDNKILLIHLSKKDLKKERIRIIGAMILEEVKHALFSRANLPIQQRHIVNVICDEWRLYLTPDFFEVSSQGRRYGVSTVLATQTLVNLDTMQQTFLDQVGTHITFAVGREDAAKLTPFYVKVPLDEFTEKSENPTRTFADMEKEKAIELLRLPDGIAYVAIRMRGDRFKPRMKTIDR